MLPGWHREGTQALARTGLSPRVLRVTLLIPTRPERAGRSSRGSGNSELATAALRKTTGSLSWSGLRALCFLPRIFSGKSRTILEILGAASCFLLPGWQWQPGLPPLPSCSPRSGSGLGLPPAPLSCQGLCVLLEARGFSSPDLQPSIIISFIVAFFALPLPVLGLGPVPRAPFVFEWVCLCWAGVCGAAPGAAPGAQQSSPDGAGMAWPLVRLWELIPGSSGSSRV